MCQVSPLSCAAPVKGGQGLPRHCVCWALTTGKEVNAKELPFLVSRQAPPEGLLEPGAPGEMGGALHSVRRWIAGPGPHSPVSATARLRCWPLRFRFCLKKAQSCPLFLPPPQLCPLPHAHPVAQRSAPGQAMAPCPPLLTTLGEPCCGLTFDLGTKTQSIEACFEFDEFHKQVLVFPLQGGFLCFDSFKPFSMSCQAQRLIETRVCFLDIFLVLKFPLPSVYFFLRTFVIAVL